LSYANVEDARLYDVQNSWGPSDDFYLALVRAAADCGLDPEQIERRLSTDEDVDLITEEAQAAVQAGVSGVPTFILGGKFAVSGAKPSEVLISAIRQVAANKK